MIDKASRHRPGRGGAGTGSSSRRSAHAGSSGGSDRGPTPTAGWPSISVPAANCERCLTTAPARTTQPAPSTLPSDDAAQRQTQRQAFLRNATFLGTGLALFALFASIDHGLRFAVTGSLIHLS